MKEQDKSRELNLVAQTIYDKKGFNILALDVRGISTMTDFFVIAEGSVDRHVNALSKAIVDALEAVGRKPLLIEGLREGEWVVLDYGDMVIHLFTPELRERYAIERLWQKGRLVDLVIETAEPKIARDSI